MSSLKNVMRRSIKVVMNLSIYEVIISIEWKLTCPILVVHDSDQGEHYGLFSR